MGALPPALTAGDVDKHRDLIIASSAVQVVRDRRSARNYPRSRRFVSAPPGFEPGTFGSVDRADENDE